MRNPQRAALGDGARDLALASVCVAFGQGALYSSPIFRAVAARELGWSLGAAAAAFAFGALVSLPVPLLAGHAADRWGTRAVLALGMAGGALGLSLAALTHALWYWLLTAGLLLGVGVAGAGTAAAILVARGGRRGMSFGILTGALGTGLAVGPPTTQLLLGAIGWRGTVLAQGVALFLLAAGVLALEWRARRRPRAAPTRSTSPRAVLDPPSHRADHRRRRLLVGGFFIGSILVGIYDESVYQHAYLYGTTLGLTDLAAAGLLSTASMAYIVGTIGGGMLSDLVGRRLVLVAAALASGATLLGLAYSPPEALWRWSAGFGLALGATIAVRWAAWSDALVGPRAGKDLGLVASGYPVGAALMTYGGAVWLDAGGGFRELYAAAAGVAFAWSIIGGVLTGSRAVEPAVVLGGDAHGDGSATEQH